MRGFGIVVGVVLATGVATGQEIDEAPEHDCTTRVLGPRTRPGGRLTWDRDWATRLAAVRACAAEGCAWTPVLVYATSDD